MHFENVKNDNIHLLDEFLNNAGSSLIKFRYYNKRPKSVIENHLVTYLIINNDQPVCYGHLDHDADSNLIWLGIAVAEKSVNMGFGKIMMKKLIQYGHENNLNEIFLSVDNDNSVAISLYESFGFKRIKETENFKMYQLILAS